MGVYFADTGSTLNLLLVFPAGTASRLQAIGVGRNNAAGGGRLAVAACRRLRGCQKSAAKF